ncbi:MAG: hydroxymethylglutaryl-CoA reductase (NADPH) [Verrucomicrobiales bacterium]|jgi:hydroxymethylglutaryl-CoA reductase (NADPH)
MASKSSLARDYLRRVFGAADPAVLARRLDPRSKNLPERFPAGSKLSPEVVEKRWARLPGAMREALFDPLTESHADEFAANIENFIGTVKLPLGIAGPLRVNGLFAHGDYLIPLATTEAALVASYHRGATLLSAAGGCACAILSEAINRAPAFAFETLAEAGRFVAWAVPQIDRFREIVAEVTAHGQLVDLAATIEGNHVYLNFEFTTADAAGQNMVTLCTEAICGFLIEHSPVTPRAHYVEGNLSGDKKASALAFTTVRGKKVCAEATIPAELVKKFLRTTPAEMVDYWRMSAIGGVLSGTIGVQGHYANGLAALYIACGQDAACVAESAIGVTRFELTDAGDLYAAVTLPGIVIGTVGGGTALPSQRACLEILGLAGEGNSPALAEVCCGLILAGELSIIGAMAAGHFTQAHERLARGRKK